MKRHLVIAVMIAVSCLAGCSGDKGKELFDTARFEEKQNNREHAVQLYEEIIRKYPGSETAGKAAERLAELKKGR